MGINVIFNDFSYEILPKRRETYHKYCRILNWGRRNPTKFLETFMNLEFTDHQKWILLSSWGKLVSCIVASRNSGKALTLDTKIYSEENKKRNPKIIGELEVGDRIYGGDGQLTTVIHLNPIIIEDVYEVEFEDGEIIKCNAEHLWMIGKNEIRETSYLCDNFDRFYFNIPKVGLEGSKKIVAVRKTNKKEAMRCITVDNGNGLFLCGEKKTVTHNSYLTSPLIMAYSLLFPNHHTYLLAPSGGQAQETFTKLENLAKGNLASVLGVSSFFLDECVRQNSKADAFTHDKNSYEVKLYNGSSVNTLNSVAKNIVGTRFYNKIRSFKDNFGENLKFLKHYWANSVNFL